MKGFGLSAVQYGIANLAIVGSLITGRYLATGLTRRFSSYAAYMTGAFLPFAGGVLLICFIYLKVVYIPTVLIALSIAVTGFGTLLPIGVKSIMTAFRDRAGTASALHGCLTMGMASAGCLATTVLEHKMHISALSSLTLFTVTTDFIMIISGITTKKYLC